MCARRSLIWMQRAAKPAGGAERRASVAPRVCGAVARVDGDVGGAGLKTRGDRLGRPVEVMRACACSARQCSTTSGRSPWISSQVSASWNVERWSSAALRAMRRLGVEQPRLQREDLLQAFDVAPGDREQAELDAPLERICREALPASGQAERLQQ